MKISVVIPTHNRPQYLEESLRSVLNQSLSPYEVLVVNNGDNKVKLPSDMDTVKIIDIEPHAGAAKARNAGAALAAGDFVSFIDDDDLWHKDYLKNVSNAISRGAKCMISRLDKLQNDKVVPYKNAHNKLSQDAILVYNPGITGSNIVISKDLFKQVGGFDAKLPPSEDKSLILELLMKNIKVVTLPDNQAIIREHGAERLTDAGKMAKGIFEFTKKYGSIMNTKQKIANWLKIYRYRYEAGNKFALAPFATLYTLTRVMKLLRI